MLAESNYRIFSSKKLPQTKFFRWSFAQKWQIATVKNAKNKMLLPLEKVASSNYQRSTYFFSSAVSAFLKAPVSFSSVVFVRQYGYSWKSAAKYNPSKKEKIRHLPKSKKKFCKTLSNDENCSITNFYKWQTLESLREVARLELQQTQTIRSGVH